MHTERHAATDTLRRNPNDRPYHGRDIPSDREATSSGRRMKYALITPARNEETYLKRTIESVCAQLHLPERWVIVDDGSTDRTAEIVREYTGKHTWIELVQRDQHADRSFAGKVRAFNAGYEKLNGIKVDVVGNLDADLSFPPDYLQFLMEKFASDPSLGVAGTPFTQDDGYDSAKDSFEGENYVAGGCQLFRHTCFQQIGGYTPVKGGGIDWIAVMTARMQGWKVRSFQEMRFHHYRTLGTAEMNPLRAIADYGKRAYTLGSSPVWQLFRTVYRMAKQPYIVGGLALGWGYFWASARRVPRPVSRDMIRFYRREQMHKLRSIFSTLLRGKKLDAFHVGTKA